MCHASVIFFGVKNLTREDVENKRVIDVGSHNYNGNMSIVAEKLNPKEYIGVDMIAGPGVDVVCLGEELVSKFGESSFDTVISNELMEHARNWRDVISNMKRVLKSGGTILLTTRSKGFKIHAYPHDYWRYEVEDMKKIFSDFDIEILIADPQAPGVLLKAKKPLNYKENNLEEINLFSVVTNKVSHSLSEKEIESFIKNQERKKKLSSIKTGILEFLFFPIKKVLKIK
jgi:SAM-dependent methyltransferase